LNIIDKVKGLVEKECKSRSHFTEFFTCHILPVVKFSEILAKKIGADEEIVIISAFLHDIAIIRGEGRKNHAHLGSEDADLILRGLDYPKEKIKLICKCIMAHSSGDNSLLEAKCLYWADMMAEITELPYLFAISFVRSNNNYEEAMEKVKEKVTENWSALPDIVKELISPEYQAITKFLKMKI
jgi:uncharacterized protein